MEERVVFDFTDGKVREEFKKSHYDTFSKYLLLTYEGRKSYSVKEEESIVTVSFITEDDSEYDCIYYKKTKEDIEKLIKNNQDINPTYCYINDFDIRIVENYKEYKLKNFDASYSFWDGDVSFEGAQFGEGDVSFIGAKFGEGNVSFIWTQFGEGDVIFDRAHFGEGYVSFYRSQFGKGNVSFKWAQFGEGDVSFEEAQFGKGDVSFIWTQFGKGDVSFYEAQFGKGDVSFVGAQFGKGDVRFDRAQFGKGEVRFSWAQFGEGTVNFNDAQFDKGDVSFDEAQFGKGEVSFFRTQFGEGNVKFLGVKAENIYFIEMNLSEYEDLRFDNIDYLTIDDCILEKTLKISGINDKSKLSFKDTVNIGQICFEDKSKHVVKALKRYINNDFRIRIIELFKKVEDRYKPKGIKKFIKFIKDWIDKKEKYKKSLTMIKENYHQLGEYDGEDRAYRAYMKYNTNTWYGWPLKFFGLFGGYGTRPITIFPAMASFMAIFAWIYCTFLKEQFDLIKDSLPAIKDFWDALYYSGITFLTIGYGDISPAIDGTALRFVSITEGFIGLFLMSYLTVAVVRKLLR